MVTAVLLVEELSASESSIAPVLVSEGYEVVRAKGEQEGLALFASRPLHAVVVDLGRGAAAERQLVAAMRRHSQVPILVISRDSSEAEQVRALDCGANALVVRPFRQAELLARLRAVLRRASARGAGRGAGRGHSIQIGPLCMQLDTKRVFVDGAEIELTPTEFSMLEVMALRVGDVVTHRQLLQEVWGVTSTQDENSLRVFVFKLRRKLQPTSKSPKLLHTALGVGYKLRAPENSGL